jgi:hypothetical protein
MMKITTQFEFGDRVTIDRGDITGIVTAIAVYGTETGIQYEVSWWHQGEHKSAWFYAWRVSPCG